MPTDGSSSARLRELSEQAAKKGYTVIIAPSRDGGGGAKFKARLYFLGDISRDCEGFGATPVEAVESALAVADSQAPPTPPARGGRRPPADGRAKRS